MTDTQKIDNKTDDTEGTDPKKNEKVTPKAFDPQTLADEDFETIFDDPRLWKHERFKKLNEKAKKASELEKAEEERREKDLEQQKKHQELAEKYKQERDQLRQEIKNEKVENKLIAAASKAGVVDIEAVLKLVDRAVIETDDEGNVKGFEEALNKLLETKPYLKGDSQNSQVNIGSGTNPDPKNTGAKRFTLSQIQDPSFYQENKDEIMSAYKAGTIIDDTQQK